MADSAVRADSTSQTDQLRLMTHDRGVQLGWSCRINNWADKRRCLCPWTLYLVTAVQYSPQVTLLKSGDITPDLFKSSAALLPETLLLERGRACQEGGVGGFVVATASYCQAQRSGGHNGWEEVRMAEPTPQDWPTPRRLRLQKQMYVRRTEVGWSSATRHQGGRGGFTVKSFYCVDDYSLE